MGINSNQNFLVNEINMFGFRLALQVAKDLDHTALQSLGLDMESIAAIKELNADQLSQLAGFGGLMINLKFNTKAIELGIKHIGNKSDHDSFIDELISMEAPFSLLEQYTSIDKSEFSNRRRMLGMVGRLGRPNLPSEDNALLIDEIWHGLDEEMEELVKYYQTSQITNIPIKNIYAHNKSMCQC